jgi:membrane protease YdiL (CAAX protease family)
MKRVWFNLFLSPLWFFLAFVLVHWVGGQINTIQSRLPHHLGSFGPTIFLLGMVFISLFFLWSTHKDNFSIWKNGWTPINNVFIEIGGGVAMGLVMAILYFAFVATYQIVLQNQFGDYVETGETAVKLVQQPLVFFIVNVAIAPILGESLFRNYAIKQLTPHCSMATRILITSAGFGLLHCLAGFWFMLITGVLVGIPFAFVAEKRKNIIWTFAAHTTLNVLEVIYFAY